MKKLYTLALALMAGTAVFAQTQRMTLLEEFTQASCGPCAAQNPALNAILAQNEAKVISIKYQTNWPGVDPMNTQTQAWVGPRVTYYTISGVPNICFDGNVIQKAAPSTLTQTAINNRYAVASPFDVVVSHAYNATYDSITISVDVTASQAAAGTLVLHTVLVEKDVTFCVAPGTNGETEFYSVMRKMLPNANGTTLATSWTVGQTQNFSFTTAVPTYVYDKKELAVVTFIQDNATKEVKQTAISNPLPIPLDASIKACGSTSLTCASSYAPTFDMTNYGTTDITSVDFSYTVAGNTQTYNWTGLLAAGATTSISLNPVTLAVGSNNFVCNITAVNGLTDFVSTNNNYTASLIYNGSSAVAAPAVEGFVTSTFPPTNWLKVDGGGTATWTRSSVGATAVNGCAKMDYYNSPNGDMDDLLTAKFDLSNVTNPSFSFTFAKGGYSGFVDQMDVMVSTDCGTTWTTEWSQSDPQLLTAGNLTTAFTATSGSATQWRTETFSLNSYVGQPEVQVMFRAISGYGNNLYLDDINVSATVGVGENSLEQQISLYPTPTSGDLFINLSAIKDNTVRISISDVTGKVVENYTAEKSNQTLINLGNLQNGSYMVQIDADGQRIIKKVVLNK